MILKWKALDDLECVKEFGLKHKIAHFIGTRSLTKCMIAFGKNAMSGFRLGLEYRKGNGMSPTGNEKQIQDSVEEVIQLHKDRKITRCEIERETVQTENGLEYGDELLITFVIKK